MDKIFKNNTVMGIIAVVTFALVAVMFVKNRKNEKATSAVPDAEEK